ncbi:FAD-dependent oxidoreductase [Limisalsivibrio acetivorans]|uniref:FAD-dependent oxidoreductase n=1 Tax=Limisalsivibrio acetivorans TaxID=1304888 RepID=UPI0003B3B37D|nr:FAD-dependent oxidoreductase [Limisalsivibrio acetivorans]
MKRLLPLYINRLSPCYSRDHLGNHGCYARNDIPRFLFLTKLGRFEEAFYVLKETNPFSSGCGRFCDHPCETACNRTKFGESVDIKALERFISDWGYSAGLSPKMLSPHNGKQVAVIGSGPGGLSAAYFLARCGYKVDVFEKHSKPGGLLTEGIPAYRYPREIFEKELEFIKKTGVNIHLNSLINKDSFRNLTSEYDAVIVATGAHKPGEINIQGETLPGVENGVEFLRKLNFGKEDELNIKEGERIGVIGGGYTAMDVVRCSVRLGAKAQMVYRRTAEEMTAHDGEVEETAREGVQFSFLRQPLRIEKNKDTFKLVTQVMKLGPVDESGRSKPVPVHGETEEFEFDRIVLAIGDKPDLFFVGESFTVDFPRMICPDLPEDIRDRIFITGDAAMGSTENTGMVVRVVGLAQDTAKSVRGFLGERFEEEKPRDIAYYRDLNTKYFQKEARLVEETLPFEEREGNFKEIVKTMDDDMAVLMAGRCFNCGICIQCDWCWYYSDGSIVKLNKNWKPDMDEFFYMFLDDDIKDATFKSVEACPRAALSIHAEGSRWDSLRKSQYIQSESLEGRNK